MTVWAHLVWKALWSRAVCTYFKESESVEFVNTYIYDVSTQEKDCEFFKLKMIAHSASDVGLLRLRDLGVSTLEREKNPIVTWGNLVS